MNKKVLIIEDNINFSETLSNIFKAKFIDVKICTSVKDAEYFMSLEQYDLLVIDIMLPVMNGIDYIHKIISDKKSHVQSKIWLMSGVFKNKNKIPKKVIKYIDLFLQKPIDHKLIEKNIDRVFPPAHDASNGVLFCYLQPSKGIFKHNTQYELCSHELMFILFHLSSVGATGVLNVKIAGINKDTEILFKDGNIINILFYNTHSYLGVLLVKNNLVSKEVIKKLLDQKTDKTLGQLLVDGCYISPHHLYNTLKDQSVIRLFQLMGHPKLHVSYKDVPSVDKKFKLSHAGLNKRNLISIISYWGKSLVDTVWLEKFFEQNKNMQFKFLNKFKEVSNIDIYPGLSFLNSPIQKTISVKNLLNQCTHSKKKLLMVQLYFRLLIKENYLENIVSVNYKAIEEQYNLFKKHEKEKTYFELMNISQHASTEHIKSSYKKMIYIVHPDRREKNIPKNIADMYNQWFISIDKIYKVLVNPSSRQKYIVYLNKLKQEQTMENTSFRDNYLTGKNLVELGSYKEALPHLKTAITQNKNNKYDDIGLYYIWATIKNSVDKLTKTQAKELSAILVNIKSPYKESALFFFIKGLYMKSTGDKASAYTLFEKSYALDARLQVALIEKQSVHIKKQKSFLNLFKKSS